MTGKKIATRLPNCEGKIERVEKSGVKMRVRYRIDRMIYFLGGNGLNDSGHSISHSLNIKDCNRIVNLCTFPLSDGLFPFLSRFPHRENSTRV